MNERVEGRSSPRSGHSAYHPETHLEPALSGSNHLVHNNDMATNKYDHGKRDGLRLALSILAAEEAKWEALLGASHSWRTNQTRAVRHKTLQVAQTRIRTALGRIRPADDAELATEVATALEELGL